MADEVVVVGIVQAKEGKADQLRQLILGSVASTHADEGCLTYAVHVSSDDPSLFVLVERWEDRTLLDRHLAKPEMGALFAALGDVLAAPPRQINLSPLPAGDPAKGTLRGLRH
jgi:quinol monooxygenase YgiN